MYALRLFGGPSVEGDQGVIGGRAVRAQRTAILALLAIADPQPVTRDKLVGFLWGECDGERARHLLSQSLYLLRGSLGDDVVLPAGDGLRLNPQRIRSDVQDFAAAIQDGEPERAVALYRGPFLDGFFLSGAPEFERWMEGVRERLARCYAAALAELAERSEARGETAQAAERWRALAAHDPYSSEVAVRLMQALDAAGQRAAALQHARIHERLLRDEVGSPPDPGVEALAARMREEWRAATPHDAAVQPEDRAAPAGVRAAPASAEAEHRVSADASPALTPPRLATAPPPRRTLTSVGVALTATVALVVSFSFAQREAGRKPAAPALAVLPFAEMSGNPSQAYFAEGIHEELLASLSRISSLRVASRTSVLPYRTGEKNARQIARELGVGYLLEGSVRRENGQVLITTQLIDARADRRLWGEQYAREIEDIFAVQREIAQQIAGALEVRLTPGELRRIGTHPTQVVRAYDLYLQGMDYARRYRSEDMEIAIGLYRRALALDPGYAMAHARLSTAYALSQELFGRGEERLDSALAAARRAVANDPELAEAHHALGTAHIAAGEHRRAQPALLRALELDPGLVGAAGNLGALHGRDGEHDRAILWFRRALEGDRRSVMAHASIAAQYAILGFEEQADEAMETAMALRPDLPPVARQHAVLLPLLRGEHARALTESDALVADHPASHLAWTIAGSTRLHAGDARGARRHLERAHELSPEAHWVAPVRVLLGHLYLASGETARGTAMLRAYVADAQGQLAAGEGRGALLRYGLAAAHAALGEEREANRWLRALLADGAGIYRFRLDDPLLRPLRGDPEYERTRAAALERLEAMRRRVE
jgi:TolB-like protein/DNA-binding SARP family transcriptional activator/Tfp pilus assembly protein PilF